MLSSPEPILHLTHPHPSRLRTLLTVTARELDVPLVPYANWLEALSSTAASIADGMVPYRCNDLVLKY